MQIFLALGGLGEFSKVMQLETTTRNSLGNVAVV